jgi:hypothetical protein
MPERGNDAVTVAVKPHAIVAVALLLVAAACGLATALDAPYVPEDAHVIVALFGLTLLAESLVLWYLPSFAKRALVAPALAQHAGPWLFPLATIGILVGSWAALVGSLLAALALAAFAYAMLGSALGGEPWRSGIPFWQEGKHRAGDAAAAVAFTSGAVGFALVAALTALSPIGVRSAAALVLWFASLGLLALGALAHLLPRGRGAPLAQRPLVVGIALLDVGAVLGAFPFVAPVPTGGVAALLLGPGIAVCAGALSRFAPEGKPAGRRAKEALPGFLVVVGFPAWKDIVFASVYAGLGALACAYAALAILALPVVMNQPPDARWILPSAGALGLGTAAAATASLVHIPTWPAAAVVLVGALAFAAALAPLRTPRRECPPEEIGA